MRYWIYFVLLLFLASFELWSQDITYTHDVEIVKELDTKAPEKEKFSIHGGWRSQFRYNNVTGSTQGSLQEEGFSSSHGVTLNFQAELMDNVFLEGDVAASFDNQDVSARHEFNLDHLLIRLYRPEEFELQFGDISARFSHYTLQRALEGFLASYTFTFPEKKKFRCIAVFGQIPRDFGGGPRQIVTGYRLEASEFLEGLLIGFDQVFINDRGIDRGQDVSTLSFNGIWKLSYIKGLEIYWDIGHSFNLQETQNNIPSQQDGWALRVGSRYQLDSKGEFLVEFENVTPDFVSPVGAGGNDRRAFRANASYAFLENLQSDMSYTFTRDNLFGGDRDHTTRSHVVNWHLGYTPFPKETEDYLNSLQLDQTIGFTKRFDRATTESNIWDFSWEARDKIGEFSPGVCYSFSLLRDIRKEDSRIKHHKFKVDLQHSKSFMNDQLCLDTHLYFSYEEEHQRNADGGYDRNRTRILGIQCQTQLYKELSLEGSFEYQKIDRVENKREGEVYCVRFEARYQHPVFFGQLATSLLIEYNLYNYANDDEEFDEFRLLSTISYNF